MHEAWALSAALLLEQRLVGGPLCMHFKQASGMRPALPR